LQINVYLNVMSFANIFAILDKPKVFLYNIAAESFNIKNLMQTFINGGISFMRKNCEVAFLSHHLGDLEITYALYLYLVRKRVIDFL